MATTHVERDAHGFVNGPAVSLPDLPNRSFVGEVHELLQDVDALAADEKLSKKVDVEIRRIVDVALAVGFDYGAEYGRSRLAG
jgi:hypothetical protein